RNGSDCHRDRAGLRGSAVRNQTPLRVAASTRKAAPRRKAGTRERRGPVEALTPMSEAPPTVCLNCGSPLRGPFCAACGQRDVPPYPSVRELAIDAISEFSGWDGRLAQTLRTLIRQPGLLTREFLEG